MRAQLHAHNWPRLALHRAVSRNELQAAVNRVASFYATPNFLTIGGGLHLHAPNGPASTCAILTIPGASLHIPSGHLTVRGCPLEDAVMRVVHDPRKRLRRPRIPELAQWLASPLEPVHAAAYHLLGLAPTATG